MSYTDEFEKFWTIYPAKRGGKIAASRSFDKAVRQGVPAEEIIVGAEQYRAHCLREETAFKYIAHATTYLNQGRWEDEYAAPEAPPYVSPAESQRKMRLQAFEIKGVWYDHWGPRPESNVVPIKKTG